MNVIPFIRDVAGVVSVKMVMLALIDEVVVFVEFPVVDVVPSQSVVSCSKHIKAFLQNL